MIGFKVDYSFIAYSLTILLFTILSIFVVIFFLLFDRSLDFCEPLILFLDQGLVLGIN